MGVWGGGAVGVVDEEVLLGDDAIYLLSKLTLYLLKLILALLLHFLNRLHMGLALLLQDIDLRLVFFNLL